MLKPTSWLRPSMRCSAVLLLGWAVCLQGAFAQQFPTRQPIRLVVPFAAGGGTDQIARALAAGMSRDLGQSVVVDNRPGAGTIIGSDLVAKSPADGYTLLVATFAHAVNPSLQARLPYVQATAFAPISLVGRSPNVLVVRPDRPYQNVAALLEAARRDPGKLSYGSFGNGTSAHLAAELFKSLARVDITHVSYRGASPALNDLVGGQIDVMFSTAASVAPHLRSGRLKALAVTSAERSPALPDVPTLVQAGVPGYVAESWYGVYAPAGTPAPVIARLNAALRQAAATEAFHVRATEEGLVVIASLPEALTRYVDAEQQRWHKVIRDASITVD